ncbi:TetR/AcrR family transcriptional regulator C-terminal domain-containing protein [Amycolatopsis jiangsuensis]|uniref:AcrR family transcriptional regulator n=1 Tax=Amycolatopsis jiangsuensis TaxID=1181879 RepID=A0A840IQQ6_9PSEU|nr:TetR/AcrR family transcriptional regulator C-terminal domain-containing protein [Amycolatopsis jiangsuensis]MBB4683785.1 AcrR family transcriptional regulator [Amycolatopsis jiangsuensis]
MSSRTEHSASRSTATLYRHFTGRDDLARQVVDAMLAEITLDEARLAAEPWHQCVAHIAEELFAALVRHENVAALAVEQVPSGPHALKLRDRCTSVLLENGFSTAEAVQTYATVARFVLGFGIQLRSESHRSPGIPEADGERGDSTAGGVGSVPLVDEFGFGLHLVIAGLRTYRDRMDRRKGS